MRWRQLFRRHNRGELARSREAFEIAHREVIRPLNIKRLLIEAAPPRPADSPDVIGEALRKVMRGQA